MPVFRFRNAALAMVALVSSALTIPAFARIDARIVPASSPPPRPPSYADLADLADGTPIVARADIRKVAPLKPGQAAGMKPGYARVYVEAKTRAVLVGDGVGESLHFLLDVPVDTMKHRPVLPKGTVLVFARQVGGAAGEVQLVAPDAAITWTAPTEARLRGVLTELVDPAAPPKIKALRDVMHVPGNLTGEGETQIFVSTARDPFAISVVRRPGVAPTWGLSVGDVIDPAARQPRRDTLLWYRLACFLPRTLPAGANISSDPADARIAGEDYAQVLGDLGPCTRTRH